MSDYLYHLDEGALTLLPGFRDATVNVFEWTFAEGRCTLAVQRERRGEHSFEEMVTLITNPYPKKFTAYAEEEAAEVAVGVPAASRRFRWRSDKGVHYHHQVFLDLGEVLLLLTASGDARTRDRVDEVLHQALAGWRARAKG